MFVSLCTRLTPILMKMPLLSVLSMCTPNRHWLSYLHTICCASPASRVWPASEDPYCLGALPLLSFLCNPFFTAAVARLPQACCHINGLSNSQVAHLNAEARTWQCVEYFKLQQQLQRPDLPPAQVNPLQEEITLLLCHILARSAPWALLQHSLNLPPSSPQPPCFPKINLD